MVALVDTNVLVRHLTGDPPAQARRATAFLESDSELVLTDPVLAEVIYVLESFYEFSREQTYAGAVALFALPAVSAPGHATLLRALHLYGRARLDFIDAYLVAVAERTGIDQIASFDRDIDRIGTVERVEP